MAKETIEADEFYTIMRDGEEREKPEGGSTVVSSDKPSGSGHTLQEPPLNPNWQFNFGGGLRA
ncbi:hypothetical protein SDC9_209657 [bioreactor metagenome]|uniref:Uncharacterized protein n=1 Tax=bioreactor metagenome TaxID=1076179 RepID=A0A645JE90_9ZZZZ